MLSILVIFVLLHIASCDIVFLKPSNGQEIPSNESITVKWKKVAGATNYSISWNSSDGCSFDGFKEPSRCNPRITIGPLEEGNWDVSVYALNQSGDIIDSGLISFRVCQSFPCPNASESERACPTGQVLRYYTSPGYKIQDSAPNFTFPADNEQSCLDACSKNTQPGAIPAPCTSVEFNNQSNTCEIYSTVTFPQGTAASEKNATTNHYEKVCMNATTGCRCRGPYFVEPGMILKENNLFNAFVSDINVCFQQCADNTTCQSGNFYYTTVAVNCFLKTESRSTKSVDYDPVPSGSTPGIYFETGCA